MLSTKQIATLTLRLAFPKITSTTGLRSYKRWVAPTLLELKRRAGKALPVENRRSSYLEWNYTAEVFAFGKRLGEDFKQDVLKRALTHRSHVIQLELKAENEQTDLVNVEDNRIFIENGEKFITNCIKAYIKENKLPKVLEQPILDYLLSEEVLSNVATNIGLRDLILTEEHPESNLTLSNTFKAIVHALYLSNDSEVVVQKFVNDLLLVQLNQIDVYSLWNLDKPYKAMEALAKARGLNDVEPRLCNQSASNTILSNYQIGLYSDKKLLGLGWGESVEIAKDTAALDAIKRFHNSH